MPAALFGERIAYAAPCLPLAGLLMNVTVRSDNKAIRKALAHLGAGRIADAERLFRSVLSSNPDDAAANHGLGLISVRRGRPHDALKLLTAALQANPAEGQHWFSFAEALLLTGASSDARNILDRAASRGLNGPEAMELRARIGHAEAIQQAVACQKAGRLEEALRILQLVLAEAPDHIDALHMMGVLAIQEERMETAVEWINRAMAQNDAIASFHSNLGSAFAGLGRHQEAIRSLRRAIELDPDYFDARNNLANVLMEDGQLDAALAQHQDNIRRMPGHAVAHNNLGNFFRKTSDTAKATECYERAIALDHGFALAHNNLGTLLRDNGQTTAAIESFQRALEIHPDFAEAHYNLGTTLLGIGRRDEALRHFERAVELKPGFANPFINLGNLHKDAGRLDQAIACYDRVIALGVDMAKANNNIGAILLEQRKIPAAIARFSEAIRLDPQLVEAYNNKGNAHSDLGEIEQAETAYRQALSIRPDYAEAMNNLAGNLKGQGRNDEAIENYRAAVATKPDLVSAHNNLIMMLGYADVPHEVVVDQARLFDRDISAALLRHRPFGNDIDPDRKLRIGYVSGDFRSHAVNYFFEPLLTHHDKRHFEIFAYTTTSEEDEVTARLKPHFDRWQNIRYLDDDAAADLIESDAIDILIDMSGHMAANRLLVFARKPAPVQATWLGFTTTTGVSAIDYRITDLHTDPVGMTERYNTETLLRLPKSFCCYEPRRDIPAPIDHVPSDDNGYVTFGCFNNFSKVTDRTLKRWAEILERVTDSRLLLEIIGIDGPDFKAQTLARLARLGLPVDRVILEPRKRSNQYVLYDRIDIALDPFPFNGGTTTLDALWMNVPVVALAGGYFTARLCASILENIGLPELIATDEDGYVARAVALAADLDRRRALRRDLRQMMARSPMMDFSSFARDIETAYREMWHIWCNSQAAGAA